ncbi:hypothetical protein B0I35DRAFT_423064 [Stachybotrys elegans]|uniref:E3 ubiquitin-protein ligase n=1 Tax=Stachybotrys elegans TaxID=80388 RepID=A0A8K0SZH8_9HYPO|nr:hypothetical protein B0I35DRAFT_423064 [Stachybotrys elegans]
MTMEQPLSTQEQQLCQFLADLPAQFNYRYTEEASRELLRNLFWSLAGGRQEYMQLLFPEGKPSEALKLSDAQGLEEGAEYTETARGKRCGHIFKPGEPSYACRTCGTDETCCLCSRCFDSTDHTGHMVRLNVSVGNSGCCDCGDEEAWRNPMFCTIHSDREGRPDKGKDKAASALPEDLKANLHMTIGRVFDYMCDVISCAPEQLRHTKTEESILKDEETSRLSSKYYGDDSKKCEEFAMVLWNDEKHTVQEVQEQLARACQKLRSEALQDAWDTDAYGRCVPIYLSDVPRLLDMAKIMEAIRVTVTIRSSRDTFREQMCGTLVEWLSDISACSVGHDAHILRRTVCEEVLKPWRQGSLATQTAGLIDDEEESDIHEDFYGRRVTAVNLNARLVLTVPATATTQGGTLALEFDALDDSDEDMDIEDDDNGSPSTSVAGGIEDNEDVMMVDTRGDVGELGMNWSQSEALEEDEATMAGYPPPPPPPPANARSGARDRDGTPSDSDTAEPLIASGAYTKANADVPKTPGSKPIKAIPRPGRYWLETPFVYTQRENVPPAEDVFQRVRLDWLILFDLRMWKKVRNDLRALYISTVVMIPEFKRVLALRFASLYTILAQLYLIGDREPDHSIILLSLQMLTTPSITGEVVERGNFLTSLMAILYTFLTTRQVGHPWDVSPDAALGFETGTVTNRRMYHFYQDLKFLFGSPHVQEKMRSEPRYLMQFFDLTKLHQGVGPNVRAVIEHVEYEADSWITASLITRQINLQARNMAEAFKNCPQEDMIRLQHAIRFATKIVIINSIGAERHRFKQGEIKDEVKFKTLNDFEFDTEAESYEVVKFLVEKDPISFHHALHHTWSWLIEYGRSLPAANMRSLLSFTAQDLRSKPRLMGRPQIPKKDYSPEDYLMAAFDFPLRICAWLAQIKANMWVRNGISLRHQATQYKGAAHRDVAHQRDIFLLQTALVVCNPSRVLASIIDRFGMDAWVKGIYEKKSEAQDDMQHLDIVEDMIHLLIVLLSDRTSLVPSEEEPNARILAMRRDIIHVLCFKPLSFNEICGKGPEKYQEEEDFHRVLDEVATYKPPEGISDVGTFELRPEFIEELDPYIAHYSKNQREESEMAFRKKMAKRTGKAVEEIVYEPKMQPISSGLFEHLGAFTNTGMFGQVIYYSLLYPLVAHRFTPSVPFTRLETFLQVVLHLILIAIQEDKTSEEEMSEASPKSFVHIALTRVARSNFMPEPASRTILSLLNMMSKKEEFKAIHPKLSLVLKRLRQKRPQAFVAACIELGISIDRLDTASPAQNTDEEERERKKKAALSRQAKVMAQFQMQQKSFLENQGGIDWGSDLEVEEEDDEKVEDRKHNWKYPSGTCILCQEEPDDRHLYGTFAMLMESRIVRQTNLYDPDMVREASQTPCSLDRSAEDIRPFGIAHENRKVVEKLNAKGETFLSERQIIGRGYSPADSRAGPVAGGCGHMMHYRCFEVYYEATNRRHGHQIARHHPEETKFNEFVCPLCKAVGNSFIPVIWKGLDESYPGYLQPEVSFEEFIDKQMSSAYWLGGSKAPETDEPSASNIYTPSLPGSLLESLTQIQAQPESTWAGDETDSHSSVIGTPASSSFSVAAESSSVAESSSNPESGSAPATGNTQSHILKELMTAYRRLRETMQLNNLKSRHEFELNKLEDAEELSCSDTLVQAVGYSISAAEIQQRGLEVQPGMTLLEKLPEQVLTQLRTIAETASSYISIGARHSNISGRIETEFRKDSERQHCQLFMSRYFGTGTQHARRPLDSYPPLLGQDCFLFFVECAYGLVPSHKADISHVFRLCYLAELVRVIYHMNRAIPPSRWRDTLENRQTQDPAINNFAEFALAISNLTAGFDAIRFPDGPPQAREANTSFEQSGLDTLEGWYMFAKKYALVFLRKSVVFLHVKYGVDFNSHVSPTPDAEELERLTEALRAPTFDEMCASMTPNAGACGWPATTEALVGAWVKHQVLSPRLDMEVPSSAALSHPGIFELIGLPKNYDALIEEASRRKCPTTGNDLTDPAICLFCGEMFCSQATCCQRQESMTDPESTIIGGAQQHMRKCQGNFAVCLNIRKCAIIFLYRMSGSFGQAPYIDKYGETDPQLRHGRQLFLNQKRYDSLIRNMVLSHNVPSLISRRLESEINNGGWDTM